MFRYQPRGKRKHGGVHELIKVPCECWRAERVVREETELNSLER